MAFVVEGHILKLSKFQVEQGGTPVQTPLFLELQWQVKA